MIGINSGSGDIQLGGTTVNLDTNLNGSGDIDAGNLKAQMLTTVSGSGDTTCVAILFTLSFRLRRYDYKETQQKKM
jgi:hypothetical protein